MRPFPFWAATPKDGLQTGVQTGVVALPRLLFDVRPTGLEIWKRAQARPRIDKSSVRRPAALVGLAGASDAVHAGGGRGPAGRHDRDRVVGRRPGCPRGHLQHGRRARSVHGELCCAAHPGAAGIRAADRGDAGAPGRAVAATCDRRADPVDTHLATRRHGRLQQMEGADREEVPDLGQLSPGGGRQAGHRLHRPRRHRGGRCARAGARRRT